MAGILYLGTSGFAYREWRGSFYPEKVRQKDMLRFYSERFNSVEINYTFRRLPEESTVTSWRGAVPDDFRFTLKAHRLITHWMRLAGADLAVSTFLDRAKLIGPKLGVILFQCPPTLAFDRGLIGSLMAYLPPTFRYAFEFRHPSWTEAREILASQGAAWCVADTDREPAAVEPLPVAPFAYVRLRRETYSQHDMQSWADRIRRVLGEGSDVFCYVKHEERGAAPELARRLGDLARGKTAVRERSEL